VIVFLELAHADVVHSRDGSERFAAGNDVAVAIACFSGWFGRRGNGRRCCRRRCRRRAFANHDAGTLIADCQLKLENLLRKHVDLCILFVDLFGQFLKLRGLSRGGLGGSRLSCRGVWRGRKSLGEPVRIRESDEN
jgi:hypothetical protein